MNADPKGATAGNSVAMQDNTLEKETEVKMRRSGFFQVQDTQSLEFQQLSVMYWDDKREQWNGILDQIKELVWRIFQCSQMSEQVLALKMQLKELKNVFDASKHFRNAPSPRGLLASMA